MIIKYFFFFMILSFWKMIYIFIYISLGFSKDDCLLESCLLRSNVFFLFFSFSQKCSYNWVSQTQLGCKMLFQIPYKKQSTLLLLLILSCVFLHLNFSCFLSHLIQVGNCALSVGLRINWLPSLQKVNLPLPPKI